MMALQRYSVVVLLLSILSCAPFRDSPYSDELLRKERSLNTLQNSRLGDVEADGVLRIAVMTDTHQNYKDMDEVVYRINRTVDVDFVAHLGDLTNSSYNFEYDQFLDSWVTLDAPHFVTIGNHDAVGAGTSLFKKVFGPSNFYFESATKRFIFFNSANLEDPEGFSPDWLLEAVQSSTKSVIIFTHIPLQDEERFAGATAQTFEDVIDDPKTLLVLNGHNHSYLLKDQNGTALLQAPRVQGAQWLLLEISGTQLNIIQHNGDSTWVTLKN